MSGALFLRKCQLVKRLTSRIHTPLFTSGSNRSPVNLIHNEPRMKRDGHFVSSWKSVSLRHWISVPSTMRFFVLFTDAAISTPLLFSELQNVRETELLSCYIIPTPSNNNEILMKSRKTLERSHGMFYTLHLHDNLRSGNTQFNQGFSSSVDEGQDFSRGERCFDHHSSGRSLWLDRTKWFREINNYEGAAWVSGSHFRHLRHFWQ